MPICFFAALLRRVLMHDIRYIEHACTAVSVSPALFTSFISSISVSTLSPEAIDSSEVADDSACGGDGEGGISSKSFATDKSTAAGALVISTVSPESCDCSDVEGTGITD